MKTIPYIKKITTANTEYRKTTSTDTNWVLGQCKRLVSVSDDCTNAGIIEGKALDFPNSKMPKQSTGKRNTPKSMCQGVIDNFNSGQYDLSDRQCDGLQEAFRIGHDIIEDFEEVEFNEVTSLPKLSSPKPVNEPSGTFSDLFEIVITVRAKS